MNRHGVQPVTDAEQRNAEVKYKLRRFGYIADRHEFKTAGKNNAAGREGMDFTLRHVPGINLTINANLTHAPGD